MNIYCYHTAVTPSGTYSKRSLEVTGRRPFSLDTELVNYDYDSEAEWEEEEEGT